MSDSFIYVGDTGNTGDKLQSYSNTVGGQTVKSEAVTPTDASGVPFGAANPQAVQVTNPVTVGNAFALDATVAGLLTNAQLRASALAVTGAFYQATQPVSGTVSVSNFPATQPVSGSVSVSNFPASQAVTGTFFQATQPVSSTTLALDTSVQALLTNTQLRASALSVTGPLTDTQLRASAVPVTVGNFPATQAVTGTFFQATQPVSAASLPLPAGAATDATVAATNPYRGTTTPYGGSTGTVTVPSGARVVSLSAHSTGGGTVTFFGTTVPVPANNSFSTGFDGLVGPGTIAFAGTDSYYVALNQ